MKLIIPDIGDGLDFDFVLERERLATLLELPEDEVSAADPGLEVHGRALMVQDAVLIRAAVKASLRFICVRCTEPQPLEIVATVDAVLEPAAKYAQLEPDMELTAEDLNVSYYLGEEIDLAPLVREAILLEVPPYPSCEEDSAACAEAQRRNLGEQERAEPLGGDTTDARWAALRQIRDRMVNGSKSE